MHIREVKPKDWSPLGTFPAGLLHLKMRPQSERFPDRFPIINLGDVIMVHSRGRWGTALITKIGSKNLTASYITKSGIASKTIPNVTNKSVPIEDCFGVDIGHVCETWHVPSDDDLPQEVSDRMMETHKPMSGSPGPTRLAAMFKF